MLRQGERWRRDQYPSIQAVGRLVRHPFSSALLLTIFFGAALYKDAPEVVANLAWRRLPLLRLLPGLLLPELRLAFVAFAGLYLLDRLLGWLPDEALLTRVLRLSLAAVTAGGLYWLDRWMQAHQARTATFRLVHVAMLGGSVCCWSQPSATLLAC